MKLKYYLRGLGVGIVVTTLILMIAFAGHKATLSDEEIMEKASELGMVMQDTESATELETESTEQVTETEQPTETEQVTETEQPDEVAADTATAEQPSSETASDVKTTATANDNVIPDTSTTVTVNFTVSGGQSSDQVASNLQQAGLVDDAKAFNTFMVKNGYDSRLSTGTFSIQAGLTYEQVIHILVK